MDMMKAILDIENKAQEIENSIDSLSANIKKETEQKIEVLLKNAEFESDAQIEKFRETIKEREEDECNEIKAKLKASLDSLEAKYTENREKWIREITDEVIKGDTK